MKEDLSLIKRYPIVEYLERKGIKPVRRTPAYALYRSPLREETHPSFKVDTEKNLWIDYAEGRGGSIIDLCMRMERCSLSEAIRLLGRNAPDTTCSPRMVCVHGTSNQERYWTGYIGKRDKETDRHIRHLAATFAGLPHERTLH